MKPKSGDSPRFRDSEPVLCFSENQKRKTHFKRLILLGKPEARSDQANENGPKQDQIKHHVAAKVELKWQGTVVTNQKKILTCKREEIIQIIIYQLKYDTSLNYFSKTYVPGQSQHPRQSIAAVAT